MKHLITNKADTEECNVINMLGDIALGPLQCRSTDIANHIGEHVNEGFDDIINAITTVSIQNNETLTHESIGENEGIARGKVETSGECETVGCLSHREPNCVTDNANQSQDYTDEGCTCNCHANIANMHSTSVSSLTAITTLQKQELRINRLRKTLPTYESLSSKFIQDEPPRYEVVTGKKLTEEVVIEDQSNHNNLSTLNKKRLLGILIVIIVLIVSALLTYLSITSRRTTEYDLNIHVKQDGFSGKHK